MQENPQNAPRSGGSAELTARSSRHAAFPAGMGHRERSPEGDPRDIPPQLTATLEKGTGTFPARFQQAGAQLT